MPVPEITQLLVASWIRVAKPHWARATSLLVPLPASMSETPEPRVMVTTPAPTFRTTMAVPTGKVVGGRV